MATESHLWAVGYDDMQRASQVRDEIARLGWGEGRAAKYLILLDLAVVVRHPDGSFTLDHGTVPAATNVLTWTAVGFLAGLVLGAPLTGTTVGAALGGTDSIVSATTFGIRDEFVREVEGLMKPGTSALFILDDGGDMEVILHTIQGLGGAVLKTNVNLERARLIQATLAASQSSASEQGRSVAWKDRASTGGRL